MENNQKYEEALLRLSELEKIFNLEPKVKAEFKENSTLYCSDATGSLIKLPANFIKLIREFEEKYNTVAYHCLYNTIQQQKLLSILFVSNFEDEWALEHLEKNFIFSFVLNLTSPNLSEFGDIFLTKSGNGGLLRYA